MIKREAALTLIALLSVVATVGCESSPQLSGNHSVATTDSKVYVSTTSHNPAGSDEPGDAVLRYVTASTNRDAQSACDLITQSTVEDIRQIISASPDSTCTEMLYDAYSNGPTGPIDASEEHPSVASIKRVNNTARVRIDFGVAPDSGITIQDKDYIARRIGARWLVDESRDSN